MARDYARIMTVIWKNREFRALSEGDQRMYLMLVTQPDIDAAGVLKISLEWWADMAPDSRSEDLAQRLIRLEQGRFIGLDRLTGEVLIRSFIRWDGGFHNPKRKPVITRAIEEVRSPRLVDMIEGELRRNGALELMPDREPGGLSDDWAPEPPDGSGHDDGHDPSQMTFSQVECLPGSEPGALPGTEPGRDMVTTSVGREETATHNPQSRRAATRDATDTASRSEVLFDEFWSLYPRKVKKVDARKAWTTTVKGTKENRPVAPERLVKAIRWQVAQWQSEAKEIRFIPHPGSWLRAGQYDDEPEESSHLALVRAGPVLASFEDYRLNAAGPEAAKLLGIAYLPRSQPPSDDTPPRQWATQVAVEWIDDHERQIRAALTEKGRTA